MNRPRADHSEALAESGGAVPGAPRREPIETLPVDEKKPFLVYWRQTVSEVRAEAHRYLNLNKALVRRSTPQETRSLEGQVQHHRNRAEALEAQLTAAHALIAQWREMAEAMRREAEAQRNLERVNYCHGKAYGLKYAADQLEARLTPQEARG